MDALTETVVGRTSTARRDGAPAWLWRTFAASLGLGLALWLIGLISGSIAAGAMAMWLFVAASVCLALVLPMPAALVAPLFMGIVGWLVDMLPLVILAGWSAVVARWGLGVIRARRWPSGRWVAVPVFLVAWTALGVFVIARQDFKHFLLLLAIQVLISGAILAVVDSARDFGSRVTIVAGLLSFLVVCTGAVTLRYFGIPLENLQHEEISDRVEEAYGLDAFPNNIGMVKYALSTRGGAGELRERVKRLAGDHPGLPEASVFLPKLGAFTNEIVVRFAGSGRAYADELQRLDIELIYDNVGLAPAGTVPRWRSFARNSLTYAGLSAALFPLGWYFAWSATGRRRWLGRAAVVASLLGAGFALARGAWIVILIAIVYLVVEGRMSWRHKGALLLAPVAGAALLSAVFLLRYGVDPLTARAGAEGSVITRGSLYEDTVESLHGIHIAVGFGTEQTRSVRNAAYRYVPRAGTHSTYLSYLFRTGAPGMLGIALLYGLAAWKARSAARRLEGREKLFATLMTAAALGVAAHAVILNLYVEPMYTLAIALISGVALATGLGGTARADAAGDRAGLQPSPA